HDVALVAIGGYGRGQLAPGSDLDLILVHEGRKDVGDLAQRIWYPIWDTGLKLDHSVKTVKEALQVAASDLKASLGVLAARAIAGNVALGETLRARAHEQWRKAAGKWLPVLDEAVRERHAANGDIAFLLEPDLKEGRGGLRDATVLSAVGVA